MGKLLMKLKIVTNYSKSLKSQNYTLTKIFIMWQDIKQGKWFLIKRDESIGKPKDL